MNAFTLTPLQCACPTTRRLPLHHHCSIQPEAPGHLDGGRRRSPPPPPRATTTMPSSPSRTLAAAGSPGRSPTGGAIAASTPLSGHLHRHSGTSGSSAEIFPAITARGDCRKTTRCPRCRPHLLWPRASPPRGVPSCSSRLLGFIADSGWFERT